MKGKFENVECQICNRIMSFSRIKYHINKTHTSEITLEEYLQKYYQTLPFHQPCVICNKKVIYKYKTCSKECHSILKSNLLKNKPKPE